MLATKDNSTSAERYFQKFIKFWLPVFLGSFWSFASSYLGERDPSPTEPLFYSFSTANCWFLQLAVRT